MENDLNKVATELLVQYPLYRKIAIPEELESAWEWNKLRIKFYCKVDKTEQTFGLRLPMELEEYYGRQPEGSKVYPFDHFDSDRKLNFTIHIQGHCSYCNRFRIDFLIKVFKDKTDNLFARKIGAYPPFEILPDKEILNYLNEQHQEFYKKALMNFSTGYGIGAFAYLRRITEETIKRVIQDIISLELSGYDKVKDALDDYNRSHAMSTLLSSINPYLPKALLDVGDNPLRLLYESASKGIHEMSEEECLDKAELINVLLQFVIKKINEEKGTTKDVREAIKKLRQ